MEWYLSHMSSNFSESVADETQMQKYKLPHRRLRVFSFDPKTSVALDRLVENELTLKVPWEDLTPGPVGEYVEVIDFDPESDYFYPPVDLNSHFVLAQDGIPPAEGDPRFHQQMVYALVMTTLSHFEQGLGRWILWSPRRGKQDRGEPGNEFVRRLRIYPHALRGPNAYYSPSKKALLMGYSSVSVDSPTGNPVLADSFTCLSPSIISHETTHAVLDGLSRAILDPSVGPEELAVQEAIADVIALLQQFALPGFLVSQLTFTSDLDKNERLLEELARRLSQPAGIQADLRRHIGQAAGPKQSTEPRIVKLQDLAAVLVATLFEVFLTISRKRIARLLGVAAIGVNEQRDLNRDLQDAISTDVAKSASHLLRMCIRAIDYCPPAGVTYGDYLRAMITADNDLFGEDERGYRVILADAFRRRGIYPSTSGAMSPLDLVWQPPDTRIELDREFRSESYPAKDRRTEFDSERERCRTLHLKWQAGAGLTPEAIRQMGLALDKDDPHTIERADNGLPRINVDSFRLARRIGPKGEQVNDWVITVSQMRRGYFDPETQKAQDDGEARETPDFTFRGGCTLLVDAGTLEVRYCMSKSVLSLGRLAKLRESLLSRISVSPAFAKELKKKYEDLEEQEELEEDEESTENEEDEPFFALRNGLAGLA